MIAEGHVFPGGEIHDQPLGLAVLGDMADAGATARAAIGAGPRNRQRLAVQADFARNLAARLGKAAQDLQQLGLAVAGDAGDAQDLAGADGQVDAAQPLDLVAIKHAQAADFQHGGAGPGRGLVHPQQDLAPDHQFGKLRGAGLGGAHAGDHLATAHHADVVGDLHDLAQLVGDQDDGLALIAQPAQDAEQVICLGRGQHAGGFVQDQDVGAAIQGLEDLDPLLVTDRQILDQFVGIDLQFVFLRQALQFLPRPRQRGAQQRPVLGPQDDVFQHCEILHQLEMLEYHADAGADRRLAVGDRDGLARDQDFPRVRPVKAIQDRHQGGLAGAVFADDAVDGATRHNQIDVPVGLDRTERLGNPAQFDGGGAGVRHYCTGQVLSVM